MARKAVGYPFFEKGFCEEPNMYLRMYPASGMNDSVGDLLNYLQEPAKNNDKDNLLFNNPHVKKEMFTETYRSYGANSDLAHGFWQYANNPEIFEHEGGTYGFKTQVTYILTIKKNFKT